VTPLPGQLDRNNGGWAKAGETYFFQYQASDSGRNVLVRLRLVGAADQGLLKSQVNIYRVTQAQRNECSGVKAPSAAGCNESAGDFAGDPGMVELVINPREQRDHLIALHNRTGGPVYYQMLIENGFLSSVR